MKKIYLNLTGLALLFLLFIGSTQAQITVQESITDATCNGACDGAIDITPSGGTGYYTYTWSNAATTEDISGLCQGTYDVTITENLSVPFTWTFTPNPSSSTVLVVAAGVSVDASALQVGDVLGVFFDQSGTLACGGYGLFDAAAQTAGVIALSGMADAGGDSGFQTGEAYTWMVWRAATGVVAPLTATYSGPGQELYSTGGFSTVIALSGTSPTATMTATYSGTVNEPAALGINGLVANVTVNGGTDGSVDISITNAVMPITYNWSNGTSAEDLSGVAAGTYGVTATDANGCTVSDSYLITAPSSVILSATTVDATCFGGSNGSIDLTITGGITPYTITWSNTMTTEDISGLTAAIYNVTVSDAGTALTTGSYVVGEGTEITVSGAVTDVSCNGLSDGAIDISVSNGVAAFSYLWSNTSAMEDISSLAANTYSVVVTDANSCTGSGSFTVNEPATLSLTLVTSDYFGYGVSAFGASDGTIDLTVVGGNGSETYAWSNSASSQNISALAPATYSVTVTDLLGCSATGSATITEPADPTLYVTETISDASCFSYCDGAIDLAITGGIDPISIMWSNGATTEDITGLCAGTYTVTVSDNGYVGTGTFDWTYTNTGVNNTHIILIPPANLTIDGNPATTGDVVGVFYDMGGVLTCGGYTPFSSTGNNALTAWGAQSGSDDGFQIGEAFTWKLWRASDGTIIDLTPTYSATGGAFSHGGTYGTGGLSGVDALVGTAPNLGPAQQTFTSTFTVNEPAGMALTLTTSDYAGYGVSVNGASDGSVNLAISGGTPTYLYAWSTGATTQNISGLAAAAYSVTVTDAQTCTATASAVITEPAQAPNVLTISGVETQISCNGVCDGALDISVSGGTGTYVYTWSNSETTQDISALCAGTYSVTVNDVLGTPFDWFFTNTGISNNHSVFISSTSLTVDGAGFQLGDYIGVFYDSAGTVACGGYKEWDATAAAQGGTVIPAWGAQSGATDGFQIGETFMFKYYRASDNVTVDLTATFGNLYLGNPVPNGSTYVNGGMSYAEILTGTSPAPSSGTFSATIVEPALLAVSLVPSDYSGYGVSVNGAADGAIDATISGGTAPITQLWSNAETTEDINGIIAGTYTVVVTDANGCTATASETLTEPDPTPNLVVSGSTVATSCNATCDGAVNLATSGGTTPYTFTWSGGESTEDISGLCAGTYTVTVSDASTPVQQSIQSFTVTEPTALTLTLTGSDYAGFGVSAYGASDGTIDLAVSGGTPTYTYNWSNTSTMEDQSGLAAGTYSVIVTDNAQCTATGSVTLSSPPVPALSAVGTHTNADCFGNCNGTINVLASGGVAPYTYTWAGAQSGANPTGLCAGTYTVTVADSYTTPQEEVVSFTVTEPAALTLSLVTFDYSGYGVSAIGASDGSIDLTISGGTAAYTIAWDGGASTEDISSLSPGIYGVTVTDANGCSASGSASVTEPPLSPMSASGVAIDASCEGVCNGSVDLTVSGGILPYAFNWSNGETTEDVSALCDGTYSVTITDAGGGSNSAPFNWFYTNTGISNNHSIFISATSLTVDGAGIQIGDYIGVFYDSAGVEACGGYAEWTATSASQGGTVISTWGAQSGADDGFQIGETFAFKYYRMVDGITVDLTATFGSLYLGNPVPNGSTYSAGGMSFAEILSGNSVTTGNQQLQVLSFTIGNTASLLLSAQTTDALCFGSADGTIDLTVSNGTPAYTYTWSNAATSEDLGGLAAGTYDVTVIDANGCSSTASYTIGQPSPVSAIGTASDVLCFGATDGGVDLSVFGGTPSYTYLWSDQSTMEDLSGVAAGSYSVVVTDMNGCTTNAAFTISEPAMLTLAEAISNASCFGGNDGAIDLSVSGGTTAYTYMWSNLATTEDISGLAAGNYDVTVTDNNQCSAMMTYTVTEPDQIVITGTVVDLLCNGDADGSITTVIAGGTGAYTFLWSSGEATQSLSGLTANTYMLTVTDANGCTASETFTVTEPAVLTAGGQVSNVLCNGDSNGEIFLAAAGGTPTYTYAWSNGASTDMITGLVAGDYTVTVTDMNGCSAVNTFTVTQPDALVLTEVVTDATCFGAADGSIDLTVAGGTPTYTYLWDGGASTEDLGNLSAGTYMVTVTDMNGCIATTSVVVAEPALLVVTGTATNVSCYNGTNGSIDLAVSGGTTSYTYAWSNQATTEDLANVTAGTYTVIVTDANGCSATETFTITEPTMISISGAATDALCFGAADGTVSIDVTGGTPTYTYMWTGGAMTEDLAAVAQGTYDVVVTDMNGCTATASFTVAEPNAIAISAQVSDVSCFSGNDGSIGAAVSGGTPTYTYMWSNSESTNNIMNLTMGSYDLTVTDANGCVAVETFAVNEPDLLVVTGTASDATCNGATDGSVDISVSGGTASYSYDWGLAGTSEDLMNVAAGTYDVVVTDMNGCMANAQFVVNEPAALMLNATATDVLCFGDNTGAIDLTVGGGTMTYSYAWSNGASTEDLNGLLAGNYDVVVTDMNGCTASAQYTVNEPAQLMANGQDIDIACNGAANGQILLSVTGGVPTYSYLWSNGATTADLSGLDVGNYNVIITDMNGCTASASFIISQPTGMLTSISGTDATYFGALNAAADLTVSGGLAPYTYLWSNGSSTEDLMNVAAGTYEVTITDANGCEANDMVTMNQPPEGPQWFYTNTGITHSILVPDNADLSVDGIALSVGDYIGVFYDSLGTMACGGYMMYTGQTASFDAMGAQSGMVDGFAAAEEFQWKVWKALEDMDYDVVATYMPAGTASITDEQFFAANGASGITKLQSDTWAVLAINIPQNWSLVSLNVIPDDMLFENIVAPIVADILIAKSETGASFWPVFGVNQIGTWITEEAYRFNMANPVSLTVEGDKVDPTITPVTLPINWSLIAYLRQDAANAPAMVASIASNMNMMKNYKGWVYWPLFGFNSIGNMNPGEGYLVKMNSSDVLYYPDNAVNVAKSGLVRQESANYTNFRNTGSNMSVAIPMSAWDKTPQAGDEIGVFTTSGMLVGSAVYNNDLIVVPVWANDKLSNKVDGMNESEAFIIKVWNNETGKEEILDINFWEMGDGTFTAEEMAMAGKLTTLNVNENTLGVAMPNPVRTESVINFSLAFEADVTITVYNVLGEMMEVLVSENKPAGKHQITFNADKYATGAYFYKMETSEFSATKQMNIIK